MRTVYISVAVATVLILVVFGIRVYNDNIDSEAKRIGGNRFTLLKKKIKLF